MVQGFEILHSRFIMTQFRTQRLSPELKTDNSKLKTDNSKLIRWTLQKV